MLEQVNNVMLLNSNKDRILVSFPANQDLPKLKRPSHNFAKFASKEFRK
jgi:hypothetical protein